MKLHWLLMLWRQHQGLLALAAAGLTFGVAWVRIFMGQRTLAGVRAPERWYTTYPPAAFVEPSRWDLRALNRDFPSEPAPTAAEPSAAEPPEPV